MSTKADAALQVVTDAISDVSNELDSEDRILFFQYLKFIAQLNLDCEIRKQAATKSQPC